MKYKALRVNELPDGSFSRQIETLDISELPEGDVLVRVHYSALNYKDALSATGHKGVTRKYPHTPGIDAAGVVEASDLEGIKVGDKVIVTSYDLGMNTAGGFSEYIRVPHEWVVPLPDGLTLRESMILGTAGFTAGLALHQMERMGQHPDQGKILVSGASGGVGSLAIAILTQAGYQSIASTGSEEAHDFLRRLGASEIISREDANDDSGRPLVRPKWAGAIDTVGDNTLNTALKACLPHGNVASCGLVASPKLPTTVYPFIINGVNLLGVDSATCPMSLRLQVWEKLATSWKIPHLEEIATTITLEELDQYIDLILKGKTRGKVVIDLR